MSPRLQIPLALLAAAGIVVVSAALAAPLHEALVGMGVVEADGPAGPEGFLKVFRRLLMVGLGALVFVWLKPWRDGDLASYGLRGPDARLRPGLLAFGVTTALLLAILAWHFAAGWLRWEDPLQWGKALWRLARTFVAPAALVAIFEEWFFRGWMQRHAGRRLGFVGAAFGVSAAYAFIHAFRPSTLTVAVPASFSGALEAFGAWVATALDPVRSGPACLGLFLLGLTLTAAYRRTRTLWTAVGIHMAGIWVVYSYGGFTDRSPARTWAGTKLLYDGPVAWVLLAAAALWLWRAPTDAGQGPQES